MTSRWTNNTRPAPRAGLFPMAAAALLCSAFLAALPAGAQPADPTCQGKSLVTRLAGPHAVVKKPMKDAAALRARLPELEASIRTVVGRDPDLGPAVADALIAALRDGGGEISERKMQRNEEVRWMAFQPAPGQYDAITPACLRLKKDYDAFEITVEVPDQVRAARAPVCSITATRSCAPDTAAFTVDVSGSASGAKVSYSSGGSSSQINRPSEVFTVQDNQPDAAVTFLVQAEGPGEPARTAQVYRFLMPKICGNLAYLGQGVDRTLSPAGPALTCSKSSATLPACGPPPAPAPTETIDTGSGEVAAACEGGWVARPFLFGYFPTGSDQQRDVIIPGGAIGDERFGLADGYGVGASFEKRIHSWLGWEAAAMFGRGDSRYEVTSGSRSGQDSHTVNFYALTTGPNFHLNGCSNVDFYVGPFIGYGGFGDPNYWALDHHFRATFDGDFIWGAQLGLDFPGRSGRWGWHTGLRYFELKQETDAGELQVDPLIFELGLAFQF